MFSVAALERQPNADYRARRVALARKTNGGLVVLFAAVESEGPNNLYGFRQDNNFYYLSGLNEPGAAVIIAPEVAGEAKQAGHPYTEILFLPAHNSFQEKWTGPKLGPENPGSRNLTGFDRVEVLDKIREELVRLLPQPRASVYSDVPESPQQSASTIGLEWLRRANGFPAYVSLKDVNPILAEIRRVKDAGEIALIRKATEASMAGHLAAMKAMKPGVTERQIQALIQYEFQRRGCERPAYAPIVGAGFNSTVLHYSDDSATIQAGEVVVIDVGGEYSMYATDITRTLPASGKFTPRQREIYNIVLGAQEAAIKGFRVGHSIMSGDAPDTLYSLAHNYINTHGKDLHGKPLGQYFIHGLGHFVGLSVHDVGGATVPLDKGMVFTLEPGVYIPEEKLGVRIEDLFYVDDNGSLVQLSAGLPRTVDEIEAAMAGR
ncbi:MAG TPA: aminopeptidase P N-terminal domain-containing protein [Terriglobales bacterium]|nr:aminopeptidase P N-terminal domain-containing protein [Terriglobales bacterium]